MNLLYTLALTSVYIFNSLGQYLSLGEDGKKMSPSCIVGKSYNMYVGEILK